MSYTLEIGKEFWFDFDNQTLWNRTDEVSDALLRAYFNNGLNLDSLVDEFRASFTREDHPRLFLERVTPGRDGFSDLSGIQLGIFDDHLQHDYVQSAFEDFAQGLLFDDRRIEGFRIHKMDGSPGNWVGYHRWHAFMRAAQVLEENKERWETLNHYLALAWAVQTESDPQDDVVGVALPPERLELLRSTWLTASIATIDWAFANHRFAAPAPEEVSGHIGLKEDGGRYAKVQNILSEAAGESNPRHRQDGVNKGHFWQLPHGEFIELSIYNQQLIADEGDDRGTRSALVKVLKGELQGFPRMPMPPRPAVAPENIQFISDWIDAGAPEI